MNNKIINIFEQLRQIYDIRGEVYKEKAYRNAIESLKKLTHEINIDNVPDESKNKIAGIGKGISSKILEIVTSGELAELTSLQSDPRVQAYKIFSNTIGFGPALIRGLIAKKIYTHADLRRALANKKIELTSAQKLGLKYYDDLLKRIPRAEVELLGQKFIKMIKSADGDAIAQIVGSYRRGLPTSGDIDIICVSKGDVNDFEKILHVDPCYIDTISRGSQRVTFLYCSNYDAIVGNGGAAHKQARQVDILWVPPASYAPALLYFTGSANFNQKMRAFAQKKGFRLNQMGLYGRSVPEHPLRLIPTKTEAEIFQAIGMEYVEPERRI